MTLAAIHLTLDYPPMSHGGISSALGALVQALRERGVETGVVSYDNWRPSRVPKEGAPQEDGPYCWRVTSIQGSKEIAEGPFSESASLILVHHPLLWPDGYCLAKRLGVPIGFVVHVDLEHVAHVCHREITTEQRELFVRIRQDADILVMPSRDVFQRWTETFPGTRSVLAPLPIRCFRDSGSRVAEPIFLSVGRFDYVKGSDFLPPLVSEVLKSLPLWRWCHVGGNPASPKSERRWLRKIYDALDGEQHSRFEFHNWADEQGLVEWYNRASLMVAPSRYETYGLAVREALSQGLPVVAFDCGGIRECIVSGANGVLIREFDIQEMSRVILDCARDFESRQRMGIEALEMSAALSDDEFIRQWRDQVLGHSRL